MTDRSIFTVREAPLGKDFILGCREIAGVPAPTVSVHDGSLTIHGACDLVEVYGMDGTLITTDVATQLPVGIYIVRLYHELRSSRLRSLSAEAFVGTIKKSPPLSSIVEEDFF